MQIHHFNRNETYEVYQNEKGVYFFEGDTLKKRQGKSDLEVTLWDLIDWIRTVSLTNLTEKDCEQLQAILRSEIPLNKEEVMNAVCGKKMNRLFYEHAYDLLYYSLKTGKEKFVILNYATNFFLYEEIVQILRFSALKISETTGQKVND